MHFFLGGGGGGRGEEGEGRIYINLISITLVDIISHIFSESEFTLLYTTHAGLALRLSDSHDLCT